MKKRIKLVRNLLGSLLLLSSFGLFAQGVDEQYALNDNRPATFSARPRYVFVFIGDGMSYPQVVQPTTSGKTPTASWTR